MPLVLGGQAAGQQTLTVNACGPLWKVDGPPPTAPPYGLLQAAAAPAAGVRIVTDVDAEGVERWGNGVIVWPYPPGPAGVWAPFAPASERVAKNVGSVPGLPEFDPMTIYLAETCTAYQITNQAEFKARATLAMEAIQGKAIAGEFLRGSVLTLNPHLNDGTGTFPNGDSVTNPVNGVGLLENAIAASGRLGLIHMTPAMLTALSAYIWFDPMAKVLRTPNGNVVIPDQGYVPQATPLGHTGATGTQEWVYATGPVDIRLSEIFTMPDTLSEALDRGSGGAGSTPNNITYRAERYALVDWDTQIHAAVRVDRCQTTC